MCIESNWLVSIGTMESVSYCIVDVLNSGVSFNPLPTNDAYMRHELP